MAAGVKTILYHVADTGKAKSFYTTLLGTEPYTADEYYVGFQIDGQEIGLVNSSIAGGKTGVQAHVHVEDIDVTHQALLDAGAEEVDPINEVGGGLRVSVVRDVDGNIIGLSQVAG